MPPESQEVFRLCVGGTFLVRDIDDQHGVLELWVYKGKDLDETTEQERTVGNTTEWDSIYVEPEYLDLIARNDDHV
jgi:hypothetical protein